MSWWNTFIKFWQRLLAIHSRRRSAVSRCTRRTPCLESVEPRCLLSVSPVVFGITYTELDDGTDARGDIFEVSFAGGAPGTQLTRIVISGDQVRNFGNLPGFSSGDVFFDTVEDPHSLGADHAFPFSLISITDAHGNPKTNTQVRAEVQDGGLQLIVYLENFFAGDKLTFEIDVDEVEVYDPSETDIVIINGGVDPVVSGAEMQGTIIEATFEAPYYYSSRIDTTMLNQYDPALDTAQGNLASGQRLPLPRDNERGNRDRTAGAFGVVSQTPLPVVIRGTVYHDRNANLQFEPALGEHGISGVVLTLYQLGSDGTYHPVLRNGQPVQTLTDAHGRYEFAEEWHLLPGTYEIREQQPSDFPISVGALPGTVAGVEVGESQTPDILSSIVIAYGGLSAENYDFAEARPARLSGYVYHDANNNGFNDPNESGIGQVAVVLHSLDGVYTFSTLTDPTGYFAFADLRPGTYTLIELQPDDWIDGQESPGTINGRSDSVLLLNDQFVGINLFSDDVASEFLFGERKGSLAGSVHFDPDGNCHEGSNAVPLAGVSFLLRDDRGRERVVVSGPDGRFVFSELGPGNYTLIQIQPDKYFNGHQQPGTGGGLVDRPNQISNILINEQQVHLENYHFCEQLGSISGYVYHDRNDNGIRELGEEGIAGAIVLLIGPDGLTRTSITDESGYYEFSNLAPGEYSLIESQPTPWRDGKDSVGYLVFDSGIGGPSGVVLDNDYIAHIALRQSVEEFGTVTGVEYNFGEWLPGSIAGVVFVDINVNGRLEPELEFPHSVERERPLQGVTLILYDASGQEVGRAMTDASGSYRFDGLRPGQYNIRQIQPTEFFDGGVVIGSGGGSSSKNHITGIRVQPGTAAIGYDFYEHPPATLSGYVFQDGPAIVVAGSPAEVQPHRVRDGRRTEDDSPIAGVWLELRSGFDGSPIDSSEALPGIYPPGPIRVQTDAQGRFVFRGLPRGNYAVYEIQPPTFVDSIDTPGTTSGIALNADQPLPLGILSRFAGNPPPPNDAILNIPLGYGQHSQENNFSEVLISGFPKLEEPPVLPKLNPPLMITIVVPPPVFPPLVPIAARRDIPIYGAAGDTDASWHLSIIDAGYPRGDAAVSDEYASRWVARYDTAQHCWYYTLRGGRWRPALQGTTFGPISFGLPGAIPLAGDFNGDGRSEIALYDRGQWFIDLNGNGRWDPDDLWLALGEEHDLPVVGDWNGDGKTDVGIFGPMWAQDPIAIEADPGLPDAENSTFVKAKNVPPLPQEATNGLRVLQRSQCGVPRADLIDHVFRYGQLGDVPVTGDWNGDGTSNIGIFRKGTWILDTNGDGRLSPEDKTFVFGAEGDVPLVGDFDGSGVPQIAIWRGRQIIIDSNRNYRLDEADDVLELHGAGRPVVGDFDGDGRDEIVLYEDVPATENGYSESVREAAAPADDSAQ
jgi:serine-aspartate repeat-containing protein C/D/E